MSKAILFSLVLTLLCFTAILGQQATLSTDSAALLKQPLELKGVVLDMDSKEPLIYANIYVIQKRIGSISNEVGHFTISNANLEKSDTIRFQYIGYKTKKITVRELDSSSVVYLETDIINLTETLIFGSAPEPEWIVKKVIENKADNYKKITSRRQVFMREREIGDIDNFELIYKKSTISELDRGMIKEIEEKTPKYVTSYTDFLGDVYFNRNTDDSVRMKLDAIRMVMLKEEYLEELQQFESVFEGILANTGEEEYWKVKSGVFGQKLDLDDEEMEEMKIDSIYDNSQSTSSFARTISYRLSFSTLSNKDTWEFLYKTGKYNYKLAGGTKVNDEDVYIIDFTPKKSGLFEGRMFISTETYALIRADFDYAPDKIGRDFHLLGLGYTENQFGGSIYFEKKNDTYVLKYFSYKSGVRATVNRSIALMKKKDRWLFDKTINELKLRLKLSVNIEESIEYLVLEEEEISSDQFHGFSEEKNIEIIYVDQFDDQLWKGYSIIEPTQQMKEYKKLAEK